MYQSDSQSIILLSSIEMLVTRPLLVTVWTISVAHLTACHMRA